MILKKLFNIFHKQDLAKDSIKSYGDVFRLRKLEEKVLNETERYIKWNIFLEPEFQYSLYNFQILLECLQRYGNELWFKDVEYYYLDSLQEELSLITRFQMMGYYQTSNKHLRTFIESTIKLICEYCVNQNIFTPKQIKNYTEQKIAHNIQFKDQLIACKQHRNPVSCFDTDHYDDYYFNIEEFYKLHKYLSKNAVHKEINHTDLKFDALERRKCHTLRSATLIFLSRFINLVLGKKIEKYRHNSILKPIDEKPVYIYNIRILFLPYPPYLYNTFYDSGKKIADFVSNDLGLDKNALFTTDYLQHTTDVENTIMSLKRSEII